MGGAAVGSPAVGGGSTPRGAGSGLGAGDILGCDRTSGLGAVTAGWILGNTVPDGSAREGLTSVLGASVPVDSKAGSGAIGARVTGGGGKADSSSRGQVGWAGVTGSSQRGDSPVAGRLLKSNWAASASPGQVWGGKDWLGCSNREFMGPRSPAKRRVRPKPPPKKAAAAEATKRPWKRRRLEGKREGSAIGGDDFGEELGYTGGLVKRDDGDAARWEREGTRFDFIDFSAALAAVALTGAASIPATDRGEVWISVAAGRVGAIAVFGDPRCDRPVAGGKGIGLAAATGVGRGRVSLGGGGLPAVTRAGGRGAGVTVSLGRTRERAADDRDRWGSKANH